MFNPQAQQNASTLIQGLVGPAPATPQTESVSELLNTLINVAGSVAQSATIVANSIIGSQPAAIQNDKAPAPSALTDQLRMLRYMLNEADGQLSRARSGLGV